MKYAGMPFGMWVLFAPSFRKQLTAVFGYDTDTAKAITKKAKPKYKAIIADLPEFEKADRFKMNIVNCAMIGAFVLSMPERPDVEWLTEYYAKSIFHEYGLRSAAFKAAVAFMPEMSFSANLLFPLLRQNHFIGFVIMDFA